MIYVLIHLQGSYLNVIDGDASNVEKASRFRLTGFVPFHYQASRGLMVLNENIVRHPKNSKFTFDRKKLSEIIEICVLANFVRSVLQFYRVDTQKII